MTDAPLAPAATSPRGLAFLELGERLRQRGQYAAAANVAAAGLAHYPTSADAHDLVGRIRADQGDDAAAVVAWQAALECDHRHAGARKGLAFVAFRAGDLAAAERHLEIALAGDPHDTSLIAALDRVRASQPLSGPEPPPRIDDRAVGILLFDGQGMRLAGAWVEGGGDLAADAASAEGAGLLREAERVTRILGLGELQQLIVESRDTRMAIVPLEESAAVMLHRAVSMPLGRLLALAQRSAQAARGWLEQMR